MSTDPFDAGARQLLINHWTDRILVATDTRQITTAAERLKRHQELLDEYAAFILNHLERHAAFLLKQYRLTGNLGPNPYKEAGEGWLQSLSCLGRKLPINPIARVSAAIGEGAAEFELEVIAITNAMNGMRLTRPISAVAAPTSITIEPANLDYASDRAARLRALTPGQRRAYDGYQAAMTKVGKPLTAKQAFKVLSEDEDFDPASFGAWQRQLSAALAVMGESRNRPKDVQTGKSIVRQSDL